MDNKKMNSTGVEDHILDVEHLSMYFTTKNRGKKSTVKAVDDVSFYVKRGETFGLVGESGCGKTTTGRTIIRLYDPTWGTVKFNGIEISGKMDRELHKYITDHIAMIFQDPIASLNPRMTVQEIIENSRGESPGRTAEKGDRDAGTCGASGRTCIPIPP
jgi:oligopeptide transport system ATP-binding protein